MVAGHLALFLLGHSSPGRIPELGAVGRGGLPSFLLQAEVLAILYVTFQVKRQCPELYSPCK